MNKTLLIQALDDPSVSLAVQTRQGELLTYSQSGIKPIMGILKSAPEILSGAYVADRVIGKAAALLLLYGGVSFIYTPVMSVCAKEALEAYRTEFKYGKLVDHIKNRALDGRCPMESKVLDVDDPAAAYEMFKEMFV